VLRPDQVASAEELREWVRQRLARFKAPREVVFVEALPKTATGKIQKYLLRQLAGRAAPDGASGSAT